MKLQELRGLGHRRRIVVYTMTYDQELCGLGPPSRADAEVAADSFTSRAPLQREWQQIRIAVAILVLLLSGVDANQPSVARQATSPSVAPATSQIVPTDRHMAQASGVPMPGIDTPSASFGVDWGADLFMLDAASTVGVAHTVASAGREDAWYFDVVLSGTAPTRVMNEAPEGERLVTAFPFGVVSLALPEPDAWVAYEDITLSAFDARSGTWVEVRDTYALDEPNELRDGLIQLGVKIGIDAMSLFVPPVAWANLLLLVPRIADELVGEEIDASTLTPTESAFRDPNVHRVVQRPWRLDPDAVDAWGVLGVQSGTLPLRVRIPVYGLHRDEVVEVRSFVAFTSEHSRFVPEVRGNRITGTAAALEPSLVFPRPDGTGSASALQVRTVADDAFVPVARSDETRTDVAWVDEAIAERTAPPAAGEAFGVEAAFVGEPGRPWLTRLSYDTRIHTTAEVDADRSRLYATITGGTFTRSDGSAYRPSSSAWSLDYLEGVAYVAVPNVDDLVVAYDEITLEAFNFDTGSWDVLADDYTRPERVQPGPATRELGTAAVEKVIDAGFGSAAGRTFGYSVDILRLVGGVLDEGEDIGVLRAPDGRAFHDPNAYRVVARPWRISAQTPGFTNAELGYPYRDPRQVDTASMRLRVAIPVRGLREEALSDVRVYVAAIESQRVWRPTGSTDVRTNEAVLEVTASRPKLLTTPPLVPERTARSDGDEDGDRDADHRDADDGQGTDETPSPASSTAPARLTLVVIPSLGNPFSLAQHDLVVTLEGPERRVVVEEDVATAFPVTLVIDDLTAGLYTVRAEHGRSSLERTIDVRGDTLDFEMVMP